MSQHHITELRKKQLLDACASGNRAELFRLVSEGCDPVEIHDECGQSPLHIASLHGQFDVVRLLVEAYGCDSEGRDSSGCIPLHAACLGGHLITAVYLLHLYKGYSYDNIAYYLIDASGNTVLHKACRSGNLALTRYISNLILGKTICGKVNLYYDDVSQYNKCREGSAALLFFNSHGDTPLHIACRCGHLNIVKYFMDEIPRVKVTASLLHVACQSGQTEVYSICWKQKVVIQWS